ncbi:MAG: SCO family protein [Acidobacteria bacterium]|nr:SCO family protein [Acidobacteriota bacterium]
MKVRRQKSESNRQLKARREKANGRRVGAALDRLLPTAFRLLLSALCLLSIPFAASAQYGRPPESTMPQGGTPDVLKTVTIEQRLNEQIPLDLTFRDEAGHDVWLGEYFKTDKPVVLALVYYQCPMLCNEVLNSLTGTLQAMSFTPGREYEVLTVSFDSRETPQMAATKRSEYLKRLGRPGAEAGWHFLTGDRAAIDRLTEAVGFHYVWDERSKQFAHASAIMVATPRGKLSHYFYGIEYAPKDLRLALVEASSGRIGSPVDQLILYCYHYDPTTGKYGLVVMNVMRAAGVLTVFGLVALILALRRRSAGDGWD